MTHDLGAMLGPFTPQAREILRLAQAEAHQRGQDAIGTRDLMIGLLEVQDEAISQLFRILGVKPTQIRALVEQLGSTVEPAAVPREVISPIELRITFQARQALKRAVEECSRRNQTHLGTEQLLLGLLAETESMAAHLLRTLGVEAKHFRDQTGEPLH